MDKFIELIQRAYQENFQVVINKIISEKIPVAFLSVDPPKKILENVNNLLTQNLNITSLITLTPPHVQKIFRLT